MDFKYRFNIILYGTHTMRRTKALLKHKKPKNLRAVQILLGHTELESTVHFIGVEVDGVLSFRKQQIFNTTKDIDTFFKESKAEVILAHQVYYHQVYYHQVTSPDKAEISSLFQSIANSNFMVFPFFSFYKQVCA